MITVVVLAMTIFFVAPGNLAYAQNGNWRVYSPPKGGFSVKTPVPLRKVMSFEGEHGASLEPDQKIQWASCYAAIETSPEDSRFGIVVFGQHARTQLLRSMSKNKLLASLSVTFMTDDDEEIKPVSETVVRTNGLTGREYIFAAIPTRGRIFDTGRKLYIIVFVGKEIDDLTSLAAEQFINSFRLRRGK